MRRAVIAGDWHGNLGHATFVVDRAAVRGIDTIIQVGDFGFGWPGDDPRLLQRLSRRLVNRGVHLLFIRGNHDCTPWLDELERDEDGLADVEPHIRYVPDGARFELGKVRFGALGGARSVDKELRVEGRDWWPDEEAHPSSLEWLGPDPLDVLITHEAPGRVPMVSLGRSGPAVADETRHLIDAAIDLTLPSVVFHGHWHCRPTATVTLNDGHSVRVEALDADGAPDGDAVVFDLDTRGIEPLSRTTSR